MRFGTDDAKVPGSPYGSESFCVLSSSKDVKMSISSSSSLCSSSEDDELPHTAMITPKKRRYRRTLFHGHQGKERKMEETGSNTLAKVTGRHNLNVNNLDLSVAVDEQDPRVDRQDLDIAADDTFNFSDDSSNDHLIASEASELRSDTSDDLSADEESELRSDTSDDLSADEEIQTTLSESGSSARDFLSIMNSTSDSNKKSDKLFSEKDEPLCDGSPHTVFTAYISIMLYAQKFSLTGEGFSALLKMVHSFLPKPCKLTTSVYKLKDLIKSQMGFKEPIQHYFCETCGSSLPEGTRCSKARCEVLQSKSLVFYDLGLEHQLRELFKDENFCNLVLRKKQNASGNIEDISDGTEYERVTNLPQVRDIQKTITFTMNTDGVAVFTSSKNGNLWPVYLAVNELPVKLRFSKKYLLTCYLYFHPEKPSMLHFLLPLMDTLKKLHMEGLNVLTTSGEMLIRCHLLAVTLDLPARAMVTNMKQFNGRFGCCYCEDEGANPPNRPMLRYYPYTATSVPRVHMGMIDDARKAATTGVAVKGIKGASPVVVLKYVDLPKTFVIDWMHSVLLGVVKTLLSMWCDASYKKEPFYVGGKMALINSRLQRIQVPDYIVRQQKSLDDHKHWKASECREWLLHYSIPVLHGIQGRQFAVHYAMLVSALFLLNQDSISRVGIKDAKDYIDTFCSLYPTFYNPEKQTMNIHMLKHLPEFVLLHGPLFHYSCFGFESMNNHLKNMIHGTRFVNSQISFAVGMSKYLPDLVKAEMKKSDLEVKSLLQLLSTNLESECTENRNEHVLGALRNYTLTRKEKILFGEDPGQVQKAHRIRSKIGTIDCEEYKRSQCKNSHIVHYHPGKYGSVKYFLKTENDLIAVVNKFQVEQTRLLDFSGIEDAALKQYELKLLPQYKQVSENQVEQELVPVRSIVCKCILIKCLPNKKIISIPPNMLEHN